METALMITARGRAVRVTSSKWKEWPTLSLFTASEKEEGDGKRSESGERPGLALQLWHFSWEKEWKIELSCCWGKAGG